MREQRAKLLAASVGVVAAAAILLAAALPSPSPPLRGSLDETGAGQASPCGNETCYVIDLTLSLSSPSSLSGGQFEIQITTPQRAPTWSVAPGVHSFNLRFLPTTMPHWLTDLGNAGFWSGFSADVINPSGAMVGGEPSLGIGGDSELYTGARIALAFPIGFDPTGCLIQVSSAGNSGTIAVTTP